MPFTPGVEACGVVTTVDPGLTGRQVGDMVAYGGAPVGAYAEEQIHPADKVVPVPESVGPVISASIMLKSMTTRYLLRRCFKPAELDLCYARGLMLREQRSLKLSQQKRAAQAKDDGAHHVINYKEEDFVASVNEITSGNGVDVVYDSVGKNSFQGSLECLKLRKCMVSFGQSSGAPDRVPLSALAAKSLFLTRPTLMHYSITGDEPLASAGEVLASVASGVVWGSSKSHLPSISGTCRPRGS